MNTATAPAVNAVKSGTSAYITATKNTSAHCADRKEVTSMTLEEIKASDKAVLIPKDIAPILGCDPYTISIKARDCPEQLGFPVCRIGCRTKIPRKAFLKWLGEDENETKNG